MARRNNQGYQRLSNSAEAESPEAIKARLHALLQTQNNTLLKKKLEELNEIQLREMNRIILKQLAPYYPNLDTFEGSVGDACDKTDVGYHTFLRLWQVFSYVIANGTNSDAENKDSSFGRTLDIPGINFLFAGLTILPMAIGVYIRLKQLQKVRERNTVAYQREQLQKINPEVEVTDNEVIAGYNDLMARGKSAPRPAQAPVQAKEEQTKKAIGSNKFANAINAIREFDIKGVKPFAIIDNIWNSLSKTALIFWPTWMVAVLVIGITAVSFPPAVPIVMGITLGISAALQIGVYVARRHAKKKAEAEFAGMDKKVVEDITNERQHELNEANHSRNELKQRLHMKKEHGFFKSLFPVKSKDKVASEKTNPAYIAVTAGKDGIISLVKNPDAVQSTSSATATTLLMTDEERAKDVAGILNSALGKKLLGSKASRNARLAVNVTNELINQYTLSAFIVWLVYATISVFAPFSAVIGAIAAAVGSGIMTAVFGGFVGGIRSLNMFAKTKQAETNFEKKVYDRLSEQYTSGIPGVEDSVNKQQAFEYFHNNVEAGKARIEAALLAKQAELTKKVQQHGITSLSKQEKYLLKLDLKKIDAFNDRYFMTQEPEAGIWTKFKNAALLTYKAINAGQTGIFVVRSLFLAGAVGAGICLAFGPAAGFIFMGIALSFAAVCIGLKMAQMYTDHKANKSESFVDTIDVRISYLKKKDKQLNALSNYLGVSTDNQPKPSDSAQPAQDAKPKTGKRVTFAANPRTIEYTPDQSVVSSITLPAPSQPIEVSKSPMTMYGKSRANAAAAAMKASAEELHKPAGPAISISRTVSAAA